MTHFSDDRRSDLFFDVHAAIDLILHHLFQSDDPYGDQNTKHQVKAIYLLYAGTDGSSTAYSRLDDLGIGYGGCRSNRRLDLLLQQQRIQILKYLLLALNIQHPDRLSRQCLYMTYQSVFVLLNTLICDQVGLA